MPTLDECASGKEYLESCRCTTQAVFKCLRDNRFETGGFPEWIKTLEVIPTKIDADGSHTYLPCVIVNLKLCPAGMIDPSSLDHNARRDLTQHEANLLTHINFGTGQIDSEVRKSVLQRTHQSRMLLASGCPLTSSRKSHGGEPTHCIIPLVPSLSSDVTGDQRYREQFVEHVRTGIINVLAHGTET